jgi:hypothetical protein
MNSRQSYGDHLRAWQFYGFSRQTPDASESWQINTFQWRRRQEYGAKPARFVADDVSSMMMAMMPPVVFVHHHHLSLAVSALNTE